MSCTINVTGMGAVINQYCYSLEGGFLKSNGRERIRKSTIVSYREAYVAGDTEGEWHIVFRCQVGTMEVFIEWKFFTQAERDTTMEAVDNQMGTTDV